MDVMDFARESVIKLAEERREKNLKKRNLVLTDKVPTYVIYARRSTKKPKSDGSEDKQENSVVDQIKACKKLAQDLNLPYKESEILIEEETSHKAGKREVFYEMIDNIIAGKYNSIIAWHPDRLARNMKDAGTIIDMLDTYTILDLKFPSYTFANDPGGKMALGIQFVLAKQYSDSLSVTTKRGSDGTVTEGKYMGKRKLGYEVSTKYFRKDIEEFEGLRKAWDLALKGYSLRMICDELERDGFRYKRIKGDRVTKHVMSEKRLGRLFEDTFYAGVYWFGENIVKMWEVDVNFETMVSFIEFIRVRELLGTRKFLKSKVKNTLFSQFVRCSECGRYMSMGLSKSRNDVRHLYMNCMNKDCPLRKKGKKVNRVPGRIIRDTMVSLLNKGLKVTKDMYDASLKEYARYTKSKNSDFSERLKIQKLQLDELKNRIANKESIINERSSTDVRRKIQEEVNSLYLQQINIEKEIVDLEQRIKEIEIDGDTPVMTWKEFLNHCQKLGNKLENATSDILIDEIARTVFLNLSVGDKKVRQYELQEPYRTYVKVGAKTFGVADGI